MEAPKVCPYSHSSLGKFVLEYQHDSSTLSSSTSTNNNNKKLLSCKKTANCSINSSIGASGSHQDLTLSIPESELTWKGGSRSTGTQMLVFRASQHVAGAKNSAGKRARLPSSSKKPGRKTVALELNRINPAKFQSGVTPAPPFSSSSTNMAAHDQLVAESGSKSKRKGSSSSVENSAGSSARVVHVNGHSSAVAGSAKSSSEINWSDCNHGQEEADSSVESGSSSGARCKNSGAARTKGLFKKTTATREIGVMTDLCGIDSVLDFSSSVGSNNSLTNRKGSSNLRLSLQPCPSLKKGYTDRCTSPGFPSKRQPFKNGGMNGFTFNGYANPDVLTLRSGPGVYQQNRKKKALSLNNMQNHMDHHQQKRAECLVDLERNGGGEKEDAMMTHKDPETGEIRPHGEFQAVDGGGGELPFKVSIPRTVLNSSNGDESCSDVHVSVVEPTAATRGAPVIIGGGSEVEETGPTTQALTSSGVTTNKKGSTLSSSSNSVQPLQKSPSVYKRRSEVQLLLDGDKPPSERISASEVPIFTAEDVSSRNTRTTGRGSGSGGGAGGQPYRSWLDSSTRKITPVDHFDYAFVSLTEKVTGIVHSSISSSSGGGGGGGGGSASSSSGGVSSSAAGSRKRNISDSDGGPGTTMLSSGKGGGSGAVLPPTKQAKISSGSSSGRANSSSVSIEENCRLDGGGVDLSSDTGAALASPPMPGSTAQDTTTTTTTNTADISKVIDSYGGSTSSLESVCSGDGGGLVDNNSPFRPDDVFASELVVFDSRGDCLLQEGEYSILMQRCSKKDDSSSVGDVPGLLTFPPLTWSSVFAGGGCNNSSKVYMPYRRSIFLDSLIYAKIKCKNICALLMVMGYRVICPKMI